MCVVALKHFADVGWVGVKNRDRNYKPVINIKQSFRRGIERLYLLDEKTKYTEGLNSSGICIISSALATKKDEKEGTTKVREVESFSSPDGKRIRTALFEKTAKEALESLVKAELCGCTLVFNKDEAFLMEGAFNKNKNYKYKIVEISKDDSVVRTNHGIFLPWSGYQSQDDVTNRTSSEKRYAKVVEDIEKVSNYNEMLDCISNTEDENPQLNPLRLDSKRKALTTTGQIMIVPEELTLYYRPIWCNMKFDFDKLNSQKSETYFQVLSSRKILKNSYRNIANYLAARR